MNSQRANLFAIIRMYEAMTVNMADDLTTELLETLELAIDQLITSLREEQAIGTDPFWYEPQSSEHETIELTDGTTRVQVNQDGDYKILD